MRTLKDALHHALPTVSSAKVFAECHSESLALRLKSFLTTFAGILLIMGRLLGIDYGTKRIGLAVTDPLNIFASPLKTIQNHEFDSFLSDYMKTESIDAFVIGYPVQMNNKPSESVKYIDPFIRRLEKKFPGKPVHRIDERFTSQMAFKAMIAGGVKKNDRRDKSTIDRTSAAIILQSFLDNKINKR